MFIGGIGVAFAEGYVELAMKLERRPVHLGVFKHDLEVPRVDVAYETGQLGQHRVARGFGEGNVELEVQIQVVSGFFREAAIPSSSLLRFSSSSSVAFAPPDGPTPPPERA